MRFSVPVLFLCFGVVVGCARPGPIPTGYLYHDGAYNVQPGPDGYDLGYDYSLEKNEEILEIWGLVAQDLLSTLEEQVPLTKNVFYLVENRKTTFTQTFDHVLREELTDRGYVLTTEPRGALHLSYAATAQSMPTEWEETKMLQDFMVSLSVDGLKGEPETVEGVYKLPHYGYSSDRAKFLRMLGLRPLDVEPAQNGVQE